MNDRLDLQTTMLTDKVNNRVSPVKSRVGKLQDAYHNLAGRFSELSIMVHSHLAKKDISLCMNLLVHTLRNTRSQRFPHQSGSSRTCSENPSLLMMIFRIKVLWETRIGGMIQRERSRVVAGNENL